MTLTPPTRVAVAAAWFERALRVTILAVLLLLVFSARATQVYVDSTTGAISNCGTYDRPCRSISAAVERSSTGGEIILFPGEYRPTFDPIPLNLTYV